MAGYLRQWEKQNYALFGAFKNTMESRLMDPNWNPPRIEEVRELFKSGTDDITKAFGVLTKGYDLLQREQLARFVQTNTVTLISSYDPRTKQRVGIVDWDDMCIIIGALRSEVCSMCPADKQQTKACSIRNALLRIGAQGPDKGFAFGACEFSKM